MKEFSLKEEIRVQIKEAKRALEIALQNESLADPEFVEIAIEEVALAQAKLNLLIRKAKLLY